jgi:DNA mismatch repair ATPase MutS
MAAAGDVDAAIAVASYRAGHDGWTRPRFLPPGSETTLTDVWHPLLDQAVPNSIVMPAGRGVLVTGSNMSGKSTFLRTVGVNAVLAQTVHTCLATDYAAPMFHVRSSIGRSDDLLAGKSYYLVEVESLVALVRASHADAPHLILLDELFRGTNAVERIAAGQAVLRELVAGEGLARHVVIAATHDGELVDLLPDLFAAVHFGDTVREEGMVFDHLLRPGPATSRNAIALLQLNGAPERMVRDALNCAAVLDQARASSSAPRS